MRDDAVSDVDGETIGRSLEKSIGAFSFVSLLDDYTRECPDRLRSLHNFIAFPAYADKIERNERYRVSN